MLVLAAARPCRACCCIKLIRVQWKRGDLFLRPAELSRRVSVQPCLYPFYCTLDPHWRSFASCDHIGEPLKRDVARRVQATYFYGPSHTVTKEPTSMSPGGCCWSFMFFLNGCSRRRRRSVQVLVCSMSNGPFLAKLLPRVYRARHGSRFRDVARWGWWLCFLSVPLYFYPRSDWSVGRFRVNEERSPCGHSQCSLSWVCARRGGAGIPSTGGDRFLECACRLAPRASICPLPLYPPYPATRPDY